MATIQRLELNEVEAVNRYRDIIEEELAQDAIDYGTEPGLRALHVVSRAGEVDLARALLRKNANVNFCTTKGLTPLHYAVLSGKPGMIRLLLLYGARINTRSLRDGKTPLFLAAEKGNVDIVKLLYENGGNPKIPDFDDTRPSEIAACNGYFEIKDVLEEYSQRYRSSEEITPNPVFALMRHRQQSSSAASPMSPLSSMTTSPSIFLPQSTAFSANLGTMQHSSSQPMGFYSEPPPSYEEVMNSDSLLGCTAYSHSPEDSDTTALLADD